MKDHQKLEIEKKFREWGEFERGELKQFIEMLSKDMDIPYGTIQTFYYTKLKPKFEEEKQVQTLQEATKDRPLIPPYNHLEEVEVEVTHIAEYGVFMRIIDEWGYTGLLHISEIKDDFINSPHMYFDEGDRLTVKVLSIDKKDYKIAFTTKYKNIPLKRGANNYEVKPKLNSLEDKLSGVAEDVKLPKEEPKPSLSEKDMEKAINFMNGIVGALSPKAKDKLKEVVESKGMFEFTLAMAQVSQEFENDPGLQFLEQVEEKIGDGL